MQGIQGLGGSRTQCHSRRVDRPTFALLYDLLKPSTVHHPNPTLPRMQTSNSSPGSSGASGEITSMQDYEQYPRAFVVRRLFVFVGIVIGWAAPLICPAVSVRRTWLETEPGPVRYVHRLCWAGLHASRHRRPVRCRHLNVCIRLQKIICMLWRRFVA